MADVKPIKLVDQGAGVGRLVEFAEDDTLPISAISGLPEALAGKVDAVAGMGLSSNDFTDPLRDKLIGIESGAQVNAVTSVNSRTGAVTGLVENTDPRLSDSREWTATTVSQAEAEAGTATTRRAWTAQRVRQAIVAWWNGVSSAWGRGFVASADAAAGRTALGLGSAATRTALGSTGALYSRDSILGTVSQSGGVPTGAIIERGSNVNGEFVRYADGTQICIANRSVQGSIGPGSSYVIGVGEAAAVFISTPSFSISNITLYTSTARVRQLYGSVQSYNTGNLMLINTGFSPADVAPSFSSLGPETAGAADYVVTAIGRWY